LAAKVQSLARGKATRLMERLSRTQCGSFSLATFVDALMVLTPGKIEAELRAERLPHAVRSLADLYPGGLDGEPLSAEASTTVGLCQAARCCVCRTDFRLENRFASFGIRVAAHASP
jgi:hypothetical protein